MDKSNKLVLIVISFVLGIVIGGFGVKYIFITGYGHYSLDMLNDIERMSYNFHRAYEPKPSGEAQAAYILYSYRAWKAGMISDYDLHLHQSIAYFRMCISYERREKKEAAEKACILSKKELNLWNENLSFDEFRSILDTEHFTIDMLPKQSLNNGTNQITIN